MRIDFLVYVVVFFKIHFLIDPILKVLMMAEKLDHLKCLVYLCGTLKLLSGNLLLFPDLVKCNILDVLVYVLNVTEKVNFFLPKCNHFPFFKFRLNFEVRNFYSVFKKFSQSKLSHFAYYESKVLNLSQFQDIQAKDGSHALIQVIKIL